MDSDEEGNLSHVQSKQYALLRSDLSAALAAFDRAQDWADLIHDLQRVNRVLNKHSSSSFLPEKPLLAKRLAQCLITSILPSGVHLKALETYNLVFTRIGPARLARDLPFYAGGLFPLLSHCSTSLKPPLLSLYENHFIPLGVALAPVLDGFVLAILPGVEDESSDFYTRSRNLLDSLEVAVADTAIFARALWRALLLSPPSRLSAANYLRSKLSAGNDALRAEMVSDMPLVAYAITAALSDNNALTQRSVLDLLLGELALDSKFFSCQGEQHQNAAVALVGGVFVALIRRDMSLTKRVHAWLLGGKDAENGKEFCHKHSEHLVLAAFDREFATVLAGLSGSQVSFATRPCKIAAALMDRPELSNCLGHHFAMRILKYGRAAIASNSEHEREIRLSIADVLQDLGVAPVFAELERMLASGESKSHEHFEVLTFALSLFPIRNEIVRTKHLPELLRVAIDSLDAVSTDALTLEKAVSFCSKALLSMGLSLKDGDVNQKVSIDIQAAVASFASFFVVWLAHAVETAPAELRRAYSDVTAVDEYAAEQRMAAVCEGREEYISIAKGACSFFVSAASSGIGAEKTIHVCLQATAKCANTADVRISLAGARAFAEVSAFGAMGAMEGYDTDDQALCVIRRCWRQLHPSLRTATPQSAQVLLGLQRRFPEQVKIVIADGILSTDLSRRLRNLERFACLWRLAVEHRIMPLPADNGLFLMFDALTDDEWAPKMLARSWLSNALELDVAAVIDAPLRLLLTAESRTAGPGHQFAAIYDAPRALYGFQVLRSILESCRNAVGAGAQQGFTMTLSSQDSGRDGKRGKIGIRALGVTSPSPRTVQALAAVFSVNGSAVNGRASTTAVEETSTGEVIALDQLLPTRNYIEALTLACLGYLRGQVPEKYSAKVHSSGISGISEDRVRTADNQNDDLQWIFAGLGFKSLSELHAGVSVAAAECLATLLTAIPAPSQMSAIMANLFAEPILALLQSSTANADPVLQLHYLNAVGFLVTANGPSYSSSMDGRLAFMKSDIRRSQLPITESLSQFQNPSSSDQKAKGILIGSVEGKKQFLPWFLNGVARTCRPSQIERDTGSLEVLGIRRKWIQFMDTVMMNIGVSLPIFTEGLLLVLSKSLKSHNSLLEMPLYSGDNEFSRIDERLILLEGLTVVVSNVLWSFEYALSNGDLKDDANGSNTLQSASAPTADHNGIVSSELNNSSNGGTRPSVVESGAEPARSSSRPDSFIFGGGVTPGPSDKSNNVTAATAAMMNAMNPLRMINDFVKDVLSGSTSEGSHRNFDPRRSGARVLFNWLPDILEHIAKVWGPATDALVVETRTTEALRSEESNSPRLSTEIPRERRQAQRAAVISILEPVFNLRPTDMVASVISLFYNDHDEFGRLKQTESGDTISSMGADILYSLAGAAPGVVVSCTKTIIEQCAKWDSTSVEAAEGAAQAELRKKALRVCERIIESNEDQIDREDYKVIGRMATGDFSSALAGGTSGFDLSQTGQAGSSSVKSAHQDLFHAGDLFASYSPGTMETASLTFLEHYFGICKEQDDIQSIWPTLHALLKDALAGSKRKASIPALLKMVGAFISSSPSPYPDRRYRREISSTAASIIAYCSSIAAGTVDISNDELRGTAKDFKKHLSVMALKAMAATVPSIIDSTFLDDKPQLTNSITICLSPAVATLKRTAARASAIQVAAESSKRLRSTEQSARQRSESILETTASKAAAEVILNISKRDWGVKFSRREVLALIEDPNFFYGKEGGVLEQISGIVREVVAGGGATSLLSSIGSTSSNGPPGIPGLFAGRDSETVLRARAIRRVAFCVFVAEPDFYAPQLPTVLERIRDALRMSESSLVVECLLCFRALLVRTGATSISAFRATTLSEMFHIASNPTEDLKATFAALKFLDVITLLSPPDYGFERCFFFGERDLPEVVPGSSLKPFKPLASKIVLLWRGNYENVDEVFAAPFRLKRGQTAFAGGIPQDVTAEFVGRYAAALMLRNSMPWTEAADVDMNSICQELEHEFVC